MKKTVNINLAGTFFHIDEDAFGKLSRYLEAIKKSLSDPQGSDEIIRDIEARIAELFSEKIETTAQVISVKELDEVIAVMGQPEDYMVDEEIFEDAPISQAKTRKKSGHKQLFRDIDNKFIGGVSSGLGHYFGIDAIWLRLLWIVLVLVGFGSPILIYILLWVLVPAAESTSDKLKMSGKAVNISNIEKKLKEQLDNAADKVKNADYDKYGKKVKSGASGFFDTLGSIFITLFKIFVKFLGVLLVITALSTLIGLIVGLFTFGSIDIWGHGEIMDYISMVDTTNTPIWLVSLLTLFAVGVPFFALFIVGLKMLIDNLKSIGTPAKIALAVLWILSIIGLGIIGLKQLNEKAYNGDSITEVTLPVRVGDTVRVAMRADTHYSHNVYRSGGFKIEYDTNNEKLLYSNDVRLIVRHTNDSVGKMVIEKKAEGNSFLNAKQRAEAINYNYSIEEGSIVLDGFFISAIENKYRDQEIEVILYLPIGSVVYAENNTYSFHRNDSYHDDILHNGDEEKYLRILNGRTECIDCPEEDTYKTDKHEGSSAADWEEEVNDKLDPSDDEERIIFDENGNTVIQTTTKDSI